jgi:nucleoside-diphosphate-sugar epimerase
LDRYLVTGGAGFIGSNLVEALLERGHAVRVLDNFSTGKRENLAAFVDDIDLVEGDLTDPADVRRAANGIDVVLHEGAIPSVPRSIEDPITSNKANVTGTLNLLVAARDAGVRRVVYASSSSVYGDQAVDRAKVETMLPMPISPYAVDKLSGEHYCQVFHAAYGLETVALRYFNVFGPRQDPSSTYAAVIPKFITALLRGEAPTVYGDGEQTRDFTYVGNVVEGNLLAATAPAEKAAGQVMNLATGDQTSLNELVDLLREFTGCDVAPVYLDPRPGDIKHSLADVSKAGERLGYETIVPFREGLRHTVAWYTERYGGSPD